MLENTNIDYVLHLADNALIISQRNSAWCGHGPVLEQDIAITNISLDLIGQARSLYQYAAELMGNGATEDSLAYLRDVREFRNCLLVEQTNGDWGKTIARQFFFSVYQWLLYTRLQQSTDERLAAIAEKSLKEVTYHVRWSSEWIIRLGDGTDESHTRMRQAIDELWPYTGELFIPADYEKEAAANGYGVDVTLLQPEWNKRVYEVLEEATLSAYTVTGSGLPNSSPAGEGRKGAMQTGGKTGIHTEQLGYILAEMQFMQRAYPGMEW